jgi:tRNA A-37 threonylcarbamoyl transferase component Bud32
MNKSFTDNFLESPESNQGITLPDEISERYAVIERLSENEIGETYLLLENGMGNIDRKRFVMKCYQKSETTTESREAELLRGLHHKGLPVFETEIEGADTFYVLREYVPGVSLEQYLYKRDGKIDETMVMNVAMELCGVLSYLHSQPAPIIHRDIKPSNIIINTDDNSVKLIDFGISRKYSENADVDTVSFGTMEFAPPEQYGFSQTDCRSDIYSLGVVLRYMLTGSTDGKVENKGLNRIVEKCVAFAPKDRYKNTDAVKKALNRYHKQVKQKTVRVTCWVLSLCAAIVVGFAIGRYTDLDIFPIKDDTGDTPYFFNDPLIEKAVRHTLNIEEGEPVMKNEMDSISGLFIYGEYVARNREELHELVATGRPPPYGTLSNLDDLRAMNNLRSIYIYMQTLSDISPLADCPQLEEIQFMFVSITDASPLTSLPHLKRLTLWGGNIEDFSHFANMKSLTYLNIGYSQLKNIGELGDVSHIPELSIPMTQITDLNGIEKLTGLRVLAIWQTNIRDFSSLNALPSLWEINISPDMERYLDTLTRDDIRVVIQN